MGQPHQSNHRVCAPQPSAICPSRRLRLTFDIGSFSARYYLLFHLNRSVSACLSASTNPVGDWMVLVVSVCRSQKGCPSFVHKQRSTAVPNSDSGRFVLESARLFETARVCFCLGARTCLNNQLLAAREYALVACSLVACLYRRLHSHSCMIQFEPRPTRPRAPHHAGWCERQRSRQHGQGLAFFLGG